MKQKATRNTIKRNYNNILNVGYANLQNLLRYDEAKFYNIGVYGWNWNAYELDKNTCIITGYRNTLGSNIDHEFSKKIDDKAKEIVNSNKNYEEKIKEIEELKQEFLNNYKEYICK